jgi:hypothetical protein
MYLFRPGGDVVAADGTASVTLSPPGSMEWHITVTSVECSSTTRSEVTIKIDGHYLEGTYTGNKDSSNTSYVVPAGSSITAEWTKASPGSAAALRVFGQQVRAGSTS